MAAKTFSNAFLTAFFCAFCTAQPLWAEADEAATPEMETLPPYVVVATRTAIPLPEVSPSVAYISQEAMARNQDHHLVDVLKREPGVVLNSNGTKGALSSLYLRGSNSDHTGFFMEGRRLNTGFGNQYNLEAIPVINLESVQLQKGASSVNYGSSGIGGVLDLQTRSAAELEAGTQRSSIEAEIGSNDYRRLSASTAHAGEDWSMTLGASFVETDNERQNDAYESRNVNTRFEYRLTEKLDFELIGLFTDTEKGMPDTVTNHSDTNFGETEMWLLSPGVRYQNEDWSGHFFYSKSQLTLDMRSLEFGFSPPFSSGLVDTRNYVESDELYLQLDYAGFENTVMSSGMVYRNDQAYNSNLDAYDFTAPERPFSERYEQVGVWSQLQLALTEALELRLGGRYDSYSDFDSSYSGRVEALYHFEDAKLTLFAKLANSYAPPSAADIAYDGDPVGTPLNPEESVSYEIGFKQKLFDDSLEFSGLVFRNEIDNLIGYAGLDAYNVNQATTEGVELSADYTPVETLELGLGYTYLTAMDEESDLRLLRRPRHVVQVSAFYSPSETLSFGLTGRGYFGREDASFGPPPAFAQIQADQEDYFVVEWLMDWQVSEQWSLFARVENLLDESYESVLGYPALGRAGYLGARFEF